MFFLQFGLGGAGVQIVETRIFWEVLWWKHIHMKNMQKKLWNNQKKTKSSDPWARSGERPGWGHGSELFFVFSMVFCSLAKTSRKPKKQKKTKSSDPWARSGERPGRGHGSELFVFFVFPWFFVCFSCEDAFITVPLKKCAFLQFAHLRPPWVPLLFFFLAGVVSKLLLG